MTIGAVLCLTTTKVRLLNALEGARGGGAEGKKDLSTRLCGNVAGRPLREMVIRVLQMVGATKGNTRYVNLALSYLTQLPLTGP